MSRSGFWQKFGARAVADFVVGIVLIAHIAWMASLRRSKAASDAEVCCFVAAQRLGCRAMTDDEIAINFVRRHLGFDAKGVLRVVELLLDAYEVFLLADSDLRSLQETLAANSFRITMDLCAGGARRRLMSSSTLATSDPGDHWRESIPSRCFTTSS